MKLNRIHIPSNDQKTKDEIEGYLTNKNILAKERISNIKEIYAGNRKLAEKGLSNLISDNEDLTWAFFLFLAMGVKDAAFYLAMSFLEGYGTIKSDFLMYLSMAIGVKLGDTQTIELVGNEPIPQNALNVANQCIAVINQNVRQIGGRQITYEEGIGYGKLLDKVVKKVSPTESFITHILPGSISPYANFVELVEDNSTSSSSNYVPDSSHQTYNYVVMPTGQSHQPADHDGDGCCAPNCVTM